MNIDEQEFNADDPRVTSYALGEMNRAERAAFEVRLARSPELRAAVNEIQETAAALMRELGSEVAQSATAQFTGPTPRNVVPFPRQRRWLAAGIAVAASIALVLGWQFHRSTERRARVSNGNAGTATGLTRETIVASPFRPASLRDVATVAYASRKLSVERPGRNDSQTVIRRIGPLRFDYEADGVSLRDSIRLSDAGRLNFNVGYELQF